MISLFQNLDIGDFKDKNIPLIYCARFITKNFLLSGSPNILIPDKIVRVSVKSLALTCLSTIVGLYPQIFVQYLDKTQKSQQISDVLFYATHTDPQLRGTIRILIASFLKAVLISNSGDYSGWIEKKCFVENKDIFIIERLIEILIKVKQY